MLAADSVYRTVRMLPNKLKYDFERKKIAEGIKKNEIEGRRENLLSDGSDDYDYDEDDVMSGGGRRGRGGGRIPLLPDTIYSQGQAVLDERKNRKRKRNSDEDSSDEYSDFINYDNMGSSTYDTADGIYDSGGDSEYDKDNDGYEQQQRGMTMTITQGDAAASISLIQALRSFSQDAVERGLLLKLKEELSWAVSVAQETLDLEILEAGKKSKIRGKFHTSYLFSLCDFLAISHNISCDLFYVEGCIHYLSVF